MAVSESWYSRAACACDLPASTSRMTLSLNSRVNMRRFVADFSDMLSLLPNRDVCLTFCAGQGCSSVFLPLPLGEGWGEGLCVSSFAPSPNPSQREGKKPRTFQQLVQTLLKISDNYTTAAAASFLKTI